MNGAQLRTRRLFDEDTGRAYVVAIDHGLLFGVQAGSEDALGAVERCLGTNPDGLFISPGLLASAGEGFAHRGAASPIVRLDYLTMDPRTKPYGDRHRLVCSPTRAAQLGADAVVMYFMLGADDGATFADNLASVGHAIDEAHRIGVAFVAEVVNWGSAAGDRRDADLLTYGCRLAAELGADVIKTEYTGDPQSMARLVAACPAPVLVLGGAKADSEEALFDMTRDALGAGVAGVVYGRNVWQADDPARVGGAVRALVHG